jgi:hypothetical protein
MTTPGSPWKLAFPVMRDPWTREECAVLLCKTIRDARPNVPPTRCRIKGITRNGKGIEFVGYIKDFEMAKMYPLILSQDQSSWAPSALLVDSTGAPLIQ